MLLLHLLFLTAFINASAGDPVTLALYTESTNELVVDDGIARTSSKTWKAWKHGVRSQRKPLPSSRLPVGASVDRYDSQYYVVRDFEIGNPPQSFNLSLDTDIRWSYVFDSSLLQWSCDESPGKRNFFRSSRSTTFRSDGDFAIPDVFQALNKNVSCVDSDNWFPYGFGTQSTDDVRLESTSQPLRKVPFVLINSINGTLDAKWHSDGVLSLTRSYDPSDKGFSTIQHLASALGSPEVSLFFRRNPQAGEESGQITIGGKDTKNCDPNWFYFDQLGKGGVLDWQLTAASHKIGAKTFGPTYVSFVTSVSGIVAPTFDYVQIVLQTNAQYDPTFAGYVVDCSKIAQFPSLEFSLLGRNGTFQLTIPAVDYVTKRSDGRCALNIDWDPWNDWTIGTSVKSYCWLMHYSDPEMFGLAKAL